MILGDNFLNLHESIKSMKNRLKGKYKEILNLIRKVFLKKKKIDSNVLWVLYNKCRSKTRDQNSTKIGRKEFEV